MQQNVNEEFYITCGDILGLKIEYIEPQIKNRWCDRHPGNGRYPGYGIIRRFHGNLIHLSFRIKTKEKINKVFHSDNDVYEFLKTIKS